MALFTLKLIVLVVFLFFKGSFPFTSSSYSRSKAHLSNRALKASYLDDLNLFKSSDKKCLVGFTTDAWNVGQRKYKDYLAVYHMYKKVQKAGLACIEIPMWEIVQGPHYDDLQRLFESYWIPDFTQKEQFILQYDLVVIPDPVLAKYMVEAHFEKEAKVAKKKAYYAKLAKQPWGVMNAYPPKERYDYERITTLHKQKYISKFPPTAVCGQDTYNKLSFFGQMQYFSHGIDDFALYLPNDLVPNKRVLLLRFKNRFDTLVQSLTMKNLNVTSAYPVTWMRKDWSPQEERLAREVDVVYFHENHAVVEWRERFPNKEVVAACHDEEVARTAKSLGIRDVFYSKKSDSEGLIKTVIQATEFHKSERLQRSSAAMSQKPF